MYTSEICRDLDSRSPSIQTASPFRDLNAFTASALRSSLCVWCKICMPQAIAISACCATSRSKNINFPGVHGNLQGPVALLIMKLIRPGKLWHVPLTGGQRNNLQISCTSLAILAHLLLATLRHKKGVLGDSEQATDSKRPIGAGGPDSLLNCRGLLLSCSKRKLRFGWYRGVVYGK